MTTMMQHPKHGRHPATGSEIENMKANGWTVCPPKVKQVTEAQTEHQGDDHLSLVKTSVSAALTLPATDPVPPHQKRAYNRKAK